MSNDSPDTSGLIPFKKGESGNPKGRPKLPDLREVMAEILGEEKNGDTALKVIVAKLRELAAKGNIKAAEVLLARGYGLPKQVVESEIKGEIKVTINLNPDDNLHDDTSA